MKLDRAVSIADLRRIAKRKLPTVIFDTIDGGAGDERAMSRNEQAFADVVFRPRPLVDVSKRSTRTTLFGTEMSMPVLLAPTGAARVIHREAEIAIARAAAAGDVVYVQGTVTAYPLEQVAAASDGPQWFQMYVPPTRQERIELLQRVKDAGYSALMVTIDTPTFGSRERDKHNQMAVPAKLTPRLLLEGASRPRWSAEFMRASLPSRGSRNRLSVTATQDQIIRTQWPVTWEDLAFVREHWDGPLLVKGIMRGDDCDRMVRLGVDGLIVSNHGGRQLDSLPGTLDVLPEVVDAVGGRASVLVDGGVRRGEDVVKAIALGAAAVLIGRPYLFGFAAGAEAGVTKALDILRTEIDRTLALVGACAIADLDGSFVSHRVSRPNRTENTL